MLHVHHSARAIRIHGFRHFNGELKGLVICRLYPGECCQRKRNKDQKLLARYGQDCTSELQRNKLAQIFKVLPKGRIYILGEHLSSLIIIPPEEFYEMLRKKNLPLYFAYDVYSCSDLSLLFHLSRRGNKLDRRIQPSVQESLNLEERKKEGEEKGGKLISIAVLIYLNMTNMLIIVYTYIQTYILIQGSTAIKPLITKPRPLFFFYF